jgi:hypothetical protein
LVRKDLLGTGNYQFSVDTFFTDSVFLATGCLSMACVILAAVLIQKLACLVEVIIGFFFTVFGTHFFQRYLYPRDGYHITKPVALVGFKYKIAYAVAVPLVFCLDVDGIADLPALPSALMIRRYTL